MDESQDTDKEQRVLRTVQIAHAFFIVSFPIYSVAAAIIAPAVKLPNPPSPYTIFAATLVVLLTIFCGGRIRESLIRSVEKRRGEVGRRGAFFVGRVIELVIYEIAATAGLVLAVLGRDPLWSYVITGFACFFTLFRYPKSVS